MFANAQTHEPQVLVERPFPAVAFDDTDRAMPHTKQFRQSIATYSDQAYSGSKGPDASFFPSR